MSSRERWIAPVLVLVLAVGVARGCGAGDAGEEPASPGSDASVDTDAPPDRDAGLEAPCCVDVIGTDYRPDMGGDAIDVGPEDCPPRPIPADVPAGWVEYPVMDCKYRLYVPPSNDLLPEGLTWEPCTTDLGPDTFDCRQVAVDWPTDIETPYALAGVSPGHVEEDGRVVLQVRKAYLRDGMSWQKEAAFMGLVVEADGPARQAFWMDYDAYQSAPMILNNLAVAPGKSTWAAVEWHDMNVTRRASFGGNDTDLSPPILLDRLEDSPDAAIAYAGASYWLKNGRAERRVIGWDGIDHGVLTGVTAAVSPATWAGDALLWAYESDPTYRLWTWTKQDGSRELTAFGSDLSKGAGNPGTDGKDLVWVQGEDRTPADEWFPTRSIMTAPFTTDAAEFQPRRLRSWVLSWIGTGHRPPVVGCGHAAFISSWNNKEPSLLIVRLSDGHAWQLRGPPAPGPHWHSPVAISCDEVFAIFKGNPMGSLRRIRLDSLGPGMPAD